MNNRAIESHLKVRHGQARYNIYFTRLLMRLFYALVWPWRRPSLQLSGVFKSLVLSRAKYNKEATEVVNLFKSIADTLASGDRVEIRGLCSFYVKEYKSYTGMNPKTKEPVQIPSKRLPFFKCGKELKERVDIKLRKGK